MAGKLAAYVDVDGVWYGPDSDVPADVAKRIDNPKAWAEAPKSDEGPYAGLKVGDLKAEIERRNEGREDEAKLPASGNKAELLAVLVADDASADDPDDE